MIPRRILLLDEVFNGAIGTPFIRSTYKKGLRLESDNRNRLENATITNRLVSDLSNRSTIDNGTRLEQ